MNNESQTWHYGFMAQHWAENNHTGPEIAYFQHQIERFGQPALDAGCGTGRLLIPFLKAGLDVDGCDVSGDMLAYCKEIAERAGLSPHLYRQALHNLDLPRQYQTIVVCGVFGIGVSHEQDFIALQRFYEHVLPGGVLLLEIHPSYTDDKDWPLWRKEARAHLPEPWLDDLVTPPDDGTNFRRQCRYVALDPLEQRLTMDMRNVLFKEKQLVSDITYTLTANLYFRNEMRVLLRNAGFTVEAELGGWTEATATADDEVIVFVARK